jgi:predicted dehydrogenase
MRCLAHKMEVFARSKRCVCNQNRQDRLQWLYDSCRLYGSINRKDIDAVVIATPDHWHGVQAVRAAQAGKDIYCEKPLSLTLEEGRAMVNATRKYNRVFQTGNMQRS